MTDKRFTVKTIEEELYPMPVYYDGNKKLGYVEIIHLLNKLYEENTMLKEHQNINCQNCQYFVSDSTSSDCLRRNDIGYEGTCIDGMDLHKLAKNCPYY